MAYSVYGGHEKLITDDGECDEEVDGDKCVDDDGSVLSLLLAEQARWEVVYGRWRAVADAD